MDKDFNKFKEKLIRQLPEFNKTQLKQINELFEPYLFYTSEKGKRVYQCSHCNKTFEVSGNSPLMKAKHNGIAKCPKCKTKAIVKCSGKVKTGQRINQTVYVAYILPKNFNEVFIRCSAFRKNFSNNKINNLTEYIDSFYYLTPDAAFEFDNEMFRYNSYTQKTDFYYRPRPNDPFYFYEGSISQHHAEYYMYSKQLENTFLKYSGYREYTARRMYRPCKYLALYPSHPALEMMSKFGLDDYVDDLIAGKAHRSLINWTGKSGPEVFNCDKQEFNYIRQNNIGPGCLQMYRRYKKYGMKIEEAKECFIDVTYWLSISTGWLYRQKEIKNIKKFVSYLKNIQDEENLGVWSVSQLYIDYVSMARDLNYDLSDEVVLYPKDLKKAHDTVARVQRKIIQERKAEKLRKKEAVAKVLYDERVKKYEYSNGVLEIQVPKTLADIVSEGQAQHNCVAGYVDRHAENKLCILFMRYCDRPDESFCTIEVTLSGEVKQFYAAKNTRPPENARAFMEEWKAWMKAQHKKKKKAVTAA